MLEHALPPAAFAEIEAHIDSCDHCRKVVAAAVTADGNLAVGTTPPAEKPLAEGSVASRYVVDTLLGKGGMGSVYLARDMTLGREVALKVHRAGSGGDRLHREAVAMAKLAHPNVVTVFEVTSIEDRLCVAMEYVRGTTLRGWLSAEPRSWRDTVDLLLDAGEGLAAAHDAGLVHRDFKPENVLVGDDDRPRVGDFGLARVGASQERAPSASTAPSSAALEKLSTPMTVTGTVLGTPAYMAPEQLAGEVVDARADQFAFCIVAWEALYGKRPFPGATLAALEESIEKHVLVAPRDLGVPDRVRSAIARGLAIHPDDRYPDMHALLAALREAARPRTRKRFAIAAAALVLLAGGGGAGAVALGNYRHASACERQGDAIRARFDGTARDQLEKAFLATKAPFAATSFDHTASVLTRATDALAMQAVSSCKRDDDSPRLADARRACLASRDSALASLLDLLDHPDPALVRRAPDAAWALYSPSPCDDVGALLGGNPESTAARTPDDTAKLARVHSLEGVGHYKQAVELAQQVVDSARARDAKDLEVEALIAVGEIKAHIESPDKVAVIDHEVLALAEARGRDLDAAVALNLLANLTGVVQHDHVAAHRYIELARAKLARHGGGNLAARGALLATETQILWDENRLGEAEKTAREAVRELEQALGPDHPKVGSALGILSEVLRAEAKNDEALEVSQRTLDILSAALGDDHPTVAGSQMNLATSLIDVKRYDEARERLLKADAVFARVFGKNHPTRAAIYGNLGSLEQTQKHYDAAIAAYRTALGVLEHIHDMPGQAAAHGDIARTLEELGRHEDAITEQQQGIAIYEQLGEEGKVRLAPALADLAGMQLNANHAQASLATAERAVGIAEARPADANPGDLSDARFSLAAAVWDTHGDRTRARKLAEAARDGQPDPDRRAVVETWLAAHQK